MLKLITSPIDWMLYLLPRALLQKMLYLLPFNRLQSGKLTLHFRGQSIQFQGNSADLEGLQADLRIHRMFRFLWLFKTQGELGFAQAYIEKTIDTPSLYMLIKLAQQNRHALADLLKNKKNFGWWHLWQHRRRHNSLKNSRKNISAHYDLGNDFYQLWLDSTMSYSSALFHKNDDSMEQAQQCKYQALLDQVGSQTGDKLLEIGCGWGGLAEQAAKMGVTVKGLTLSSQQKHYAEERLQKAGLADLTHFALQDYRHETGQFDQIISIEMFEAVGKEYWHNYFEQLNRNLKPGGKVGLQIITIDHEVAENYQNNVDFIQTYVFPGGLLPSLQQLQSLAHQHDFVWLHEQEFGMDYARTLFYWLKRFNQQTHTLENMGYDQRFRRLWRYYLDYCRVGFESKHIQVYQITLQKPPVTKGA